MEKYNYLKVVYDDVKKYVTDNIEFSDYYNKESETFNLSELSDELNVSCWTADSVTGNGSGSYTLHRWKAAEYLSHNWELMEEVADNGLEPSGHNRFEPEVWDVCIRCYLLPQVITKICQELKEESIPTRYGKDVTIW